MIPKSGGRLSEKIMLQSNIETTISIQSDRIVA